MNQACGKSSPKRVPVHLVGDPSANGPVLDHRGRITDECFASLLPNSSRWSTVNRLEEGSKVPLTVLEESSLERAFPEMTKVASRHETGSESFGIPNKLDKALLRRARQPDVRKQVESKLSIIRRTGVLPAAFLLAVLAIAVNAQETPGGNLALTARATASSASEDTKPENLTDGDITHTQWNARQQRTCSHGRTVVGSVGDQVGGLRLRSGHGCPSSPLEDGTPRRPWNRRLPGRRLRARRRLRAGGIWGRAAGFRLW